MATQAAQNDRPERSKEGAEPTARAGAAMLPAHLRLASPARDTDRPLVGASRTAPAEAKVEPTLPIATPSILPTVRRETSPAVQPPPLVPAITQPASVPAPAAPAPTPSHAPLPRPYVARRRRGIGTFASFVLFVLLPTLLVGLYYATIASPQYVVETQFAVRGQDGGSALDALGLSALPSSSGQDADSYVVQNYIESVQVAKDIERDQDIDIRKLYARPFIDPVHKIAPDTPWVDFADYWNDRVKAEYNSVTGNTTFQIFAFTARDAMAIAEAVLVQAEKVVNGLSMELRTSLIGTAQEEVTRTQERLRDARLALQLFQNATQVLDPTLTAEQEGGITTQLESELAGLRTRRRALAATVSSASPTLRVIDRQIAAVEAQIGEQRQNVGSGTTETADDNLAGVASRFVELSLDVEFAQTAYTTALAALETAETDARKQQRYLATYIPPEPPTVSRHPKPLEYTLIALLWCAFAWIAALFLIRTIREHAT